MANAILIPGKEKRVYGGHPWVFRSDIARVEGDFTPGDIVSVYSSKGKFLAKAFYNPQSQISLRIMSLHDEPIDRAFIFRRVKEAVDYRRTFADLRSCRLIFAESDRLPALIVDSFGDVLVLQCLALGMERFKQDVVDALVEEVHPQGIYERSDVPVRRLEGLEQLTGVMYGTVPDRVEMVENGVRFLGGCQGRAEDGLLPRPEGEPRRDCAVRQGKDAYWTASRTRAVSRFMRGIMARRKSRAWIFPLSPANSRRKTRA